ncbi:MAG: hypothetical protein HLUCCA11_16500 [Phormidesmis priestleyi Ana]|uniref:Uncharacterized protein n=1 Tax=Phormidesmis priestleyi Ana TaxID=1666911 RepID=A0A0P7YTW8_9CYAN|nr:MAG: hypothetical protein HLUCCA11_16500 [Phormidesmis priestleyi Ana]
MGRAGGLIYWVEPVGRAGKSSQIADFAAWKFADLADSTSGNQLIFSKCDSIQLD